MPSPDTQEPRPIYNLFPISEKSVNAHRPRLIIADAIAGRNLDILKEGYLRLDQNSASMSNFLWLRGRAMEMVTGLDFNTLSYGKGCVAGYSILEEEAQNRGGTLCKISDEAVRTYGNVLYGGERNRQAVETTHNFTEDIKGIELNETELMQFLISHPEYKGIINKREYNAGVFSMMRQTVKRGKWLYREEPSFRDLLKRLTELPPELHGQEILTGITDLLFIFKGDKSLSERNKWRETFKLRRKK